MTLAGVAIRNLTRSPARIALTVAGVAIAIVAFMLLRTVVWAWAAGSAFGARDRLVTRHKVTFVMSLPIRYVRQVRSAPHVRSATWADWFGGKDPKHETEFFTTLAVDEKTYFTVYDDMRVSPDALEAFQRDRRGAIVGDVVAHKLGWKVGDTVALRSGLVSTDLEVTIDGIYQATSKSVDRSTLVFHWDYLNEVSPPTQRDVVGWIVSRVDDPARTASVGQALDAMFDTEEPQTLSQDERSFNASFLGMFSAVFAAIDLVSGIILVVMTLVLGNTIVMGARERSGEYAVLRALGFSPRHSVFWGVVESVATGALGGLLGALAGWPFIDLFVGRFVEETMGAFLPYFRLQPDTVVAALALASTLGGLAAALPAWRASRQRVIDAIRAVA